MGYLDKEFNKRVTDKDGVYYLGKSIFYSEADTLYARWEKHEGIVYPVLMIFVDEIHAKLDTVDKQIFNLDYKMILPELKISEQIPEIISEFLNDGFNGKVHFELDAYYTNIALDKKCFECSLSYDRRDDYSILPVLMPEVKNILKNYRTVMTTAGYRDPNEIIHQASGYAHTKYATLPFEEVYHGIDFTKPFSKDNEISKAQVLAGYIHEFIHTIEQAKELNLDNLHEYGAYFSNANRNETMLTAYLLYLHNDAELYGKQTGIPFEYWTGEIQVEDEDLKIYGDS